MNYAEKTKAVRKEFINNANDLNNEASNAKGLIDCISVLQQALITCQMIAMDKHGLSGDEVNTIINFYAYDAVRQYNSTLMFDFWNGSTYFLTIDKTKSADENR